MILTFPVTNQTYGYLPSHKATPPTDWYQIILLGDRQMCVNNLSRVAFDSGEAGI